jgi:hypothetical protein
VTVVFSWRPTVGLSDGKVTSSTLLGGSSDGVDEGKAFADGKIFLANSKETKIFKRKKGKAFKLALNVSGFSCEVDIAAKVDGDELVGLWKGTWKYVSEDTGHGAMQFVIAKPPDETRRVVLDLRGTTKTNAVVEYRVIAVYRGGQLTWEESSGISLYDVVGGAMVGRMTRHQIDGGNILTVASLTKH